LGLLFSAEAVYFFYVGMVAAYTALFGVSLIILGIMLFVLGVVVKQGNIIQRDLWMLQRNQLRLQSCNRGLPSDRTIEVEREAGDRSGAQGATREV
jgi:hypothetical protein